MAVFRRVERGNEKRSSFRALRPHPPSPPLQLRIASQCCVERGSEKLSLTSRGYWGAFFRLPLSTSGAAAELERGQGGEVGEVGEVG